MIESSELTTLETTQERVFKICNELSAEGAKLSVRRVLALIPNINSTSTVHHHYKKWCKAKRDEQRTLYEQLGFSDDFKQAFVEEISRFSTRVEDRTKLEVEQVEEQNTVLLDTVAQLESMTQAQEAEIATLRKALADEQEANRKTGEQLEQLEIQHAEVTTEFSTLNQEYNAVLEKNGRIEVELSLIQLELKEKREHEIELVELRTKLASKIEQYEIIENQNTNLLEQLSQYNTNLKQEQRYLLNNQNNRRINRVKAVKQSK